MAYIATIHENHYTLETDEDDGQRGLALDGARLDIDWLQLSPLAADAHGRVVQGGRYTLLIAGRSYELFARRLEQSGEDSGVIYEILVAGQRFEVRVEDERQRALLSSLKAGPTIGEMSVRAPMPGLVLGVLKEVGAQVERGETVAVLEAMKMENDLAAPHGGTVKEVRVSKGQTVNQGDVLLIIAST